jgi:exodeoxyribonuclease-5
LESATHKEKDEDTGKTKLFWRRSCADGLLKGHLVLLDESSMISQEMGADLINSGATIIACGDPGQLPPVFGKQAFPVADFMLTEIHRQAAESPIIRQATSVRTTGRYVADTDAFQVVRSMSDAALMDADVVLCWKNATRNDLNLRIRALLGLEGIPKAGEPVLCLKNAYGLFNGGIYTLARNVKPTDAGIWLMIDGDEIEITSAAFVKKGKAIDDYDEDFDTAFDWGYVVTCHKSQGSEWPKVVVIDEYRRSNDRAQWLYTALTRAADRIIVQQ